MVCSDADNGWSRCKSFTNTEALDERERYNNTILIDVKDVCILISINSVIGSLTRCSGNIVSLNKSCEA
jgi:hypothetical protein